MDMSFGMLAKMTSNRSLPLESNADGAIVHTPGIIVEANSMVSRMKTPFAPIADFRALLTIGMLSSSLPRVVAHSKTPGWRSALHPACKLNPSMT